MTPTRTIDLEPLHLTVGAVRLMQAELPIEPSPFVLVHYTVAGKPQTWGHRLDLDKRIFLDDLESGSPGDAAAAAEKLTDFLLEEIRHGG